MERCCVKNRVCVLVSWALMLTCSIAEQENFLQTANLTWDEARKHCQACFRDLATVSPDNIHNITKKLTSVTWVGLRKKSGSPTSQLWSHWANGDPLTFQNWYPGSVAKDDAEDSCVAMLSFGAWVKRNCSEHLHYICYEDRFFGQVNLSNLTSTSATLSWLPGPGNINHYRLEVQGSVELVVNLTAMTFDLVSLMPGTLHSVQVFPVKCERDLNPEEVSFYTIPNKVENLTVSTVTETFLSLVWDKPPGNVDFYLVEVDGRQSRSITEGAQFGNLTPGHSYTFRVLSGVQDEVTWSEESSITAFTKPAEVSSLSVSKNSYDSMLLTWTLPLGEASGFRVKAKNDNQDVLFDETVTQTEVRVTGLPKGTRVALSVAALTSDAMEGEAVTVVSYTIPGPVSNLNLVTAYDSLTATWHPPKGNYSFFTIELQLNGTQVEIIHELLGSRKHFSRLETAANYTVIIYIVNGGLKGPPVKRSKFTLPLPPTDVAVSSFDKDHITFTWRPPVNAAPLTYSLKISSDFWGYSHSEMVQKQTSHTFSGLKSGTRYRFEVRTVAGEKLSTPANIFHSTDADKIEISLSMLCSSAESLLCDRSTTRESVFNQLHARFNKHLGNNIFWKLEGQQPEN